MKIAGKIKLLFFIAIIFTFHFSSNAQELYSARGYWEELNKETYKKILDKKQRDIPVSADEEAYFEDYKTYLANYYNRMSDEEKSEYSQMKDQWDADSSSDQIPVQDFNLRARDRVVNGIYGLYYGASIVAITETESGGVIAGVPLIMAGLWQLGPVINPKKYEDISLATVRAGNSGKLLGLVYGGSLGLAIGGDSDDSFKWILGLSTVGSIALGEIAFQTQKKKQLSTGHVDMMRHYGFLGPSVAGLGYLSIDQNLNVLGASLLAGGIAGVLIGNNVAKKYDYTSGDVDVVSSLSLICAGLGATIAVETIEDETNRGFLLIPAATAIAGTIFGQRSVKGVHLTRRQGSTINLASTGAALIGLGVVALTSAESPGWYVGLASVSALIMHQALFSSYKKKNLENSLNLGINTQSRVKFSMKVTPENYFIHKQMSEKLFIANPNQTYPIVNFKLTF